MMNLMLEWMISVGGLVEIKRRNERKASVLYDFFDNSRYYTTPVDNKCRSMMAVRFFTGDQEYDEKFIEGAEKAGLINLRADKNIGGMCASIYNSMPIEGVNKLLEYMKEFEQDNPKL